MTLPPINPSFDAFVRNLEADERAWLEALWEQLLADTTEAAPDHRNGGYVRRWRLVQAAGQRFGYGDHVVHASGDSR